MHNYIHRYLKKFFFPVFLFFFLFLWSSPISDKMRGKRIPYAPRRPYGRENSSYTYEDFPTVFEELGLQLTEKPIFDDLPLLPITAIRYSSEYISKEWHPSQKKNKDEELQNEIKKISLQYKSQLKDILKGEGNKKILLRFINDKIGYGIYVAYGKRINKGDLVTIYSGRVGKTKLGHSSYRWRYPHKRNTVLYIPNKKEYEASLEAMYVCNIASFCNHSDNPNVAICLLWVGCNKFNKVGEELGFFVSVYIALRDIDENEQICVSYGKEKYFSRREKLEI